MTLGHTHTNTENPKKKQNKSAFLSKNSTNANWLID